MCAMVVSVLIVDDHPSFRRSARALLEADGFTVVAEAEDAAGALDAAARLRPDVVLLDVQLPDLDGFAVAQQLTRWLPLFLFVVSSDCRWTTTCSS
jgi:DNA-binding NarL/FixJ family response regulator